MTKIHDSNGSVGQFIALHLREKLLNKVPKFRIPIPCLHFQTPVTLVNEPESPVRHVPPPDEFSILFRDGICGGYFPASPIEIHQVTRSRDAPLLVVRSAVPGGSSLVPYLTLECAVNRSLSISDEETGMLVNELHDILKTLPTEDPPGCEDVYGMDISISWESDDLQWSNDAPEGCIHGFSQVHPTKEQKDLFKRAIEIVKQLVSKAS